MILTYGPCGALRTREYTRGMWKKWNKKRKFKKFRKGLHFFVSLENQRSDFLVSADQWPLICSCTTSATQKTTSLPHFLSQILDWFLNAFIKILLWKNLLFIYKKNSKCASPPVKKPPSTQVLIEIIMKLYTKIFEMWKKSRCNCLVSFTYKTIKNIFGCKFAKGLVIQVYKKV